MNIIKKLINRLLAIMGYSISKKRYISTLEYFLTAHNYYSGRKIVNKENDKFTNFIKDNFKLSNSALFQDLFAIWVNGEVQNGYFVEFGAGNGIDDSNTLILEKKYNWKGLLIEPSSNFNELKIKRSVSSLNFAITSKSGEKVEFYETQNRNFSSLNYKPDSKKNVVKTITLNDALEQVSAPKYINFMSIDTEGSEIEALKGLDFEKYFIKCLVIEHNYHKSRKEILKILTRNNFQRVFENQTLYDDWYINNGK